MTTARQVDQKRVNNNFLKTHRPRVRAGGGFFIIPH